MFSVDTIPDDRSIFCRLKFTGKLVIVKYSPKHKLFENIRDEIYYYDVDDFTEWFDLLDRHKQKDE